MECRAFTRYLGVTVLPFALSGAATKAITRGYGKAAARRFRAGMWSSLLVQQALVGLAVARRDAGSAGHRHRLTVVDLMTLTRGWGAALLAGLLASGIRDRRGLAGWLGWISILYGAVLCDWLDGPFARLWGTSEVGVLFDREADSWLTLCSAAAAAEWGGLPLTVASAPLARYVLVFEGLRTKPYSALFVDEPGWVRRLGIVQMLLFIAALAPFRGRATSRVVGLAAPLQTLLQLYGLLALRQGIRKG